MPRAARKPRERGDIELAIKQRNPFIVPKKKKGGRKLGLNLDKIEPSNNHKGDLEALIDNLRILRNNLVIAERMGRYSAAKKIRRKINEALEAELYIRNTWCPTCLRAGTQCICKGA